MRSPTVSCPQPLPPSSFVNGSLWGSLVCTPSHPTGFIVILWSNTRMVCQWVICQHNRLISPTVEVLWPDSLAGGSLISFAFVYGAPRTLTAFVPTMSCVRGDNLSCLGCLYTHSAILFLHRPLGNLS